MKYRNISTIVLTIFGQKMSQVSALIGSIVLGGAMVLAAVIALMAMPVDDTYAQEPVEISAQDSVKNAFVVVRYSDDDVDVRVITYTGTISEWGALERAGLNPVGANSAWGLMLCGINGVGQANVDQTACDNGSYWWGTKDVESGEWQDNLGVSTEFSDHRHVSGFVWGVDWPSANPPAGSRLKAAMSGLKWLHEQQSTDGGYGDVASSAEVMMAVAANGYDPDSWSNGGATLLDYMQANGAGYANKASTTGKLMVSLAAAGQDVTTFLGSSLVTTMTGFYNSATGAYDSGEGYDQGVGPHSWAVLGMRAAEQSVSVSATHYITGNIKPEGCWEWSSPWGCDINTTALAVQALIASGVPTDATEVISGVTWLKSKQNSDGGFPYFAGESDSNSTAYVVQALLAAGEDVSTLSNGNPIDFLLSMQQLSGQFRWTEDDSGVGTATTRQVVPALLDTPLPIRRDAGLTSYLDVAIYPYYNYLPVITKNN